MKAGRKSVRSSPTDIIAAAIEPNAHMNMSGSVAKTATMVVVTPDRMYPTLEPAAMTGKIRLPSSTLKCCVTKLQKFSITSSKATEYTT
ncbi:MAG: hypothetical protein E6I96_14525 [Chloroflexi bacterium]|nr:MAG: hypothetical protein E6I96_14525 [Chloroflexota bacterium]